MTSPALRAHLRVLEQAELTVRTHTRQFGEYAGRENVNNFKEVIINGNRYRSLTAASRDLGICRESVRKMIDRGDGRFA